MTFVFSADAHVVEPKQIFDDGLPASLKPHGIRSERRGEHMCVLAGEKVLHRIRIVPRQAAPTYDHDEAHQRSAGLAAGEEVVRLHATPKGAVDLAGRIEDMALEGIDGEIVFPSTCLWTYGIEHPETELATTQIYNDWNNRYFQGHLDKFVRCGVLPVRDFANTEMEMKRLARMGFTAAMLPTVTPVGMPKYNDEAWDPVFELGGELGIVFVMHTGTGLETVQPERRAGGAVINYTNQACDAWNAIQYLVAGGLLDRHPKSRVAVIESGVVRPKLSLMPSEIVERQVSAGFQNDRACILSRSVTGVRPLLWGSDYPHAEGTFPRSKQVIERLFAGVDISEKDKADILGGNAARLFRLHRPEFQAAA
jgi:predicted TIM-barrel fold metal-dependent hydrolase